MHVALLNERAAKPGYTRLSACVLACLASGGLLLLLSQPNKPGKPVELSSSVLPLYRISASSPFDAGLQHGLLARDRIHGWFATPEMQCLQHRQGGEVEQGSEKLATEDQRLQAR